MNNPFDLHIDDIAWCPGCGNFAILDSLKKALSQLNKKPQDVVISSGIGQAAKMPQYLNVNYFNGLHGRSLPPATGIKLSNPELTVIAESGDGCTYGEGGNHFIHAIRRNPDITNLIHDNQIYGLTKGQASPTSERGMETPVQYKGVILEPFNPLAVAISLGAPFVARAFAGDKEKTVEIIKKAIEFKGFAVVDIFQPCVSFNKVNTYKWYKENTYYLKDHDPTDREKGLKLAFKEDKYPLGIIYINENMKTYLENSGFYRDNPDPLYKRERKKSEIDKKLKEYI